MIVQTIPTFPRRIGDHGTRVLVRPIDANRRASNQDERVQILLGPRFRGLQFPADSQKESDTNMGSKDEWDYFRNGKKKKIRNILMFVCQSCAPLRDFYYININLNSRSRESGMNLQISCEFESQMNTTCEYLCRIEIMRKMDKISEEIVTLR